MAYSDKQYKLYEMRCASCMSCAYSWPTHGLLIAYYSRPTHCLLMAYLLPTHGLLLMVYSWPTRGLLMDLLMAYSYSWGTHGLLIAYSWHNNSIATVPVFDMKTMILSILHDTTLSCASCYMILR